MSIRRKLIWSYIAMVAIPMILFVLSAILLGSLLFRSEGHGREWGPNGQNPFNGGNEAAAGLAFVAQHDAGLFLNETFLKSTDAELRTNEGGVFVEKNGQPLYASDFLKQAETQAQIRNAAIEPSNNPFHNAFKVGGNKYTVEKLSFTFPDQSSGTVYVLDGLGSVPTQVRTFFPLLVLLLLLVIGVTNGTLTWLVSRSILTPLQQLRKAALHIKEGRLDEPLANLGKDEIGDVGRTFEEMRLRLKDSIESQLHYEDNRKDLLANISHDLKTPITAISHCVEGLQAGIADTPEKRDKYYGMIQRKASDMNQLIEELFLFSKLDLRKLPFRLEPVDIMAYLHMFVEELAHDPSMRGIQAKLKLEVEDPQFVMADREKLRRVLLNIVDNSAKHMKKEPKRIEIELRGGDDEVTVSLRDNGPGMDSEKVSRIFERFYRADPSRNTDHGGSGLGLAIVEQIIAEHGGRVWADSSPGEGMRISFTLIRTKGPGTPSDENDSNH